MSDSTSDLEVSRRRGERGTGYAEVASTPGSHTTRVAGLEYIGQ